MKGSIQRRGDAWRIVVDAGTDPATGRRRQTVRTVRGTKRNAQDILNRLLVEAGEDLGSADHDRTVGQLLEAWMAVAKLGPRTRVDYRSTIKVHLSGPISRQRIWKVRAHHLDAFYAELARGGVSAERRRRAHSILSAAFAQAVRWRWIASNPATNASKPAVVRKQPTPPSPEQLGAILAAAPVELVVYLRLCAHLGSRRGEVCALQWGDIDLERGQLVIARSLVDGGPGVGIVPMGTKTGNVHTIAVGARTVTELRKHRAAAQERALAVGAALGATSWTFSADAAGIVPTRPDRMTKLFAAARRAACAMAAKTADAPADLAPDVLAKVKLREVRHFVATQLLADGEDVKSVSTRLGHRRTSTTLDIYAASLPARDRQLADRLERKLG